MSQAVPHAALLSLGEPRGLSGARRSVVTEFESVHTLSMHSSLPHLFFGKKACYKSQEFYSSNEQMKNQSEHPLSFL